MNKQKINRNLKISEEKEMKQVKINETYTLEQLAEMNFRELSGTQFAGYLIFYRGDYRINRERYLFHKQKGNDGEAVKYKLSVEYKI